MICNLPASMTVKNCKDSAVWIVVDLVFDKISYMNFLKVS
jgi:hypothetical protein